MNKDCFWLTDDQFARIKPHLPTDTRGKARVDDRRVISGIVHVLKSGARWSMGRAFTDRTRRSTTATSVGRQRGCGWTSSMRLRGQAVHRPRC